MKKRCTIMMAAMMLLATPAMGQTWGDAGGPEVSVTDYGTVDLAVQDTDLSQVLEMLSIQGRKNIIVSRNVSATVSANLYDVTFYEALDAILTVNGYGYVEEGNFIYVLTQEELADMQAATRRTESRIFELQYLPAADASEFIAPLLSEVGRAAARGDVQAGFSPSISDGGADSYAYSPKIVVNDYPENLEDIANLLAELDIAPQQVLIEATILQTTLNETNAYGVDFSIIADMNFLDLTNPLSPINNLLAGNDTEHGGFQPADNRARGLQSTVGNTAGAGGFKVGIIRDDISVFIKLLDEVTDLTVMARPKLMVLNRQRAEIHLGKRVGYITTTTNNTTTTESIKFIDTGVKLSFRTFISKNGMIRLELSPSVSEAALRLAEGTNGKVTVPDEFTNQLTTNVRIKDGRTLVLGGMFRESTQVSRRQVPFLGDIPILDLLFRGQEDEVRRDEIIFLITPSIVHDEILWEIGDQGLGYTDAVRVGGRRGLLPFSRDKMTANYNTKALSAFRDGDLKRALHWANTSLNQSANQATMIRLREDITGERERTFDASIMERAIRSVLGPLPRESVELPREVAGIGGGRRAPLNWVSTTMPKQPAQPTQTQPEWPMPAPAQPAWPQQQPQQPVGPTGHDGGHSDAGTQSNTDPGAVSAAPVRGVTKDVPQISANPKFWQADHPAGFDDPAWRQTVPFSTFDDVMDGNGGGNDS